MVNRVRRCRSPDFVGSLCIGCGKETVKRRECRCDRIQMTKVCHLLDGSFLCETESSKVPAFALLAPPRLRASAIPPARQDREISHFNKLFLQSKQQSQLPLCSNGFHKPQFLGQTTRYVKLLPSTRPSPHTFGSQAPKSSPTTHPNMTEEVLVQLYYPELYYQRLIQND